MEDRLIPLNAWIALLTGAGGWPTPFAGHGLVLHRLETKISTSLTNVVVDGLAVSSTRKLIVPTEAKSGPNIKEGQARRYAAMTVADVTRLHTLSFARDPDAAIAPMYACLERHVDGIRAGLVSLELDWPILTVADGRVQLEVPDGSLLTGFDLRVPKGPPPRVIPVDADSPAEEYSELLLSGLVAAAARQIALVAIETLLHEVIPYWATYARDTKVAIRQKATRAIEALTAAEFRDVFQVEAGSANMEGRVVRILRTPAAFDARGETQGWQRWQGKAQRQLRRRPKASPPGQLSFEDLGMEVDK